MEDGSIFELFQERADSGTIRAEYRTELMTTMAPEELQAKLESLAGSVRTQSGSFGGAFADVSRQSSSAKQRWSGLA